MYMGVSKNRGTPKSSILIGFSIINHPFWGIPIFGNTRISDIQICISEIYTGTYQQATSRLYFGRVYFGISPPIGPL